MIWTIGKKGDGNIVKTVCSMKQGVNVERKMYKEIAFRKQWVAEFRVLKKGVEVIVRWNIVMGRGE